MAALHRFCQNRIMLYMAVRCIMLYHYAKCNHPTNSISLNRGMDLASHMAEVENNK